MATAISLSSGSRELAGRSGCATAELIVVHEAAGAQQLLHTGRAAPRAVYWLLVTLERQSFKGMPTCFALIFIYGHLISFPNGVAGHLDSFCLMAKTGGHFFSLQTRIVPIMHRMSCAEKER